MILEEVGVVPILHQIGGGCGVLPKSGGGEKLIGSRGHPLDHLVVPGLPFLYLQHILHQISRFAFRWRNGPKGIGKLGIVADGIDQIIHLDHAVLWIQNLGALQLPMIQTIVVGDSPPLELGQILIHPTVAQVSRIPGRILQKRSLFGRGIKGEPDAPLDGGHCQTGPQQAS